MMTSDYYDVVYHNHVAEGDKEALAENLIVKFKLPKEKALLLLSTDKAVCLKKKVNLTTALKYESALHSLKLDCRIIPHQDNGEKSFIEKRSAERRTQPERREAYRSNAIQPDRRQRDRRLANQD